MKMPAAYYEFTVSATEQEQVSLKLEKTGKLEYRRSKRSPSRLIRYGSLETYG